MRKSTISDKSVFSNASTVRAPSKIFPWLKTVTRNDILQNSWVGTSLRRDRNGTLARCKNTMRWPGFLWPCWEEMSFFPLIVPCWSKLFPLPGDSSGSSPAARAPDGSRPSSYTHKHTRKWKWAFHRKEILFLIGFYRFFFTCNSFFYWFLIYFMIFF